MSARSTRPVVGLLLVSVHVGGMTAGLSLMVVNGTSGRGLQELTLLAAFTVFMAVGAVIVVHRPGNALGRVFCGVGLLAAVLTVAMEYAYYAYVTRPAGAPGGLVAAWVASWAWYPLLGLLLVGTPLLFPTGRPPTPGWRWVARATVLLLVAVIALAAVQPTLEIQDAHVAIQNPLGIAGVGDVETGPIGTVLFAALFVLVVVGAVSPVLRYRRATGEERLQLKWFAWAASLVALAVLVEEIVPGIVPPALFGVVVSLVPAAVGVAVLRHRLYEIDRIISRTVAYAVLTVLLGGLYALGVLLLGLLSPFAPDSPLAVAGSTLAVAAAFSPVRRRVQRAVDRRFHRARYDAQLIVETFRSRLRDEVDLDQLTRDLIATVGQAVEPSRAQLWLRAPPRQGHR